MFTTHIETPAGAIQIDLPPGSVTLIVGPNGVGKSALLQDVYRRLPVISTSYYPGHRQITFSHGWESMQMSLSDLDNNLFNQHEGFNRYKSVWPEEQFKAVLRRLQNSENAYNQRLISRIENGEDATALVSLRAAPMQVLNNVFKSARLSVQFILTDAGLTAVRGGSHYAVDRLSDGERAALFIVAAIVNQAKTGVVIIDEPERHLHPSISAPLISGAVRSRPDQAFIFATHDLNLIETLSVDKIIYVKDSIVTSERPERRVYEIKELSSLDAISQDLKRDILGVRDRVIFVEGSSTSLDMPLYSTCFPEWKIAARGGADKVQEAVRALNENADLHWMQVLGIVDGDGRNQEEANKLKLQKIIVLPVPSIENLFFIREVVEQVSKLFSSVDGVDADRKIDLLDSKIGGLVRDNLDEIISRRTAWLTNRKLGEKKVSVADIRDGLENISGVDVGSIREEVASELNAFLNLPPALDDVERLPIKATGIPAKLAEMTGAPTLKKYKQTVLHQLEINSTYGQAIRAAIISRLPVLP